MTIAPDSDGARNEALPVIAALGTWVGWADCPAVERARQRVADDIALRLEAHAKVEASILAAWQASRDAHPSVWREPDPCPPEGIARPTLRLVAP
jgi:hypothetical protein